MKNGYEKRYEKNLIFTPEEQADLATKRVFVAGSGGLGGYCAEMLARAGVGHIIVADGDSFDETNLNRQLLATEKNIGKSKALECQRRITEINSGIDVTAYSDFVTRESGKDMMRGADVVIDALDSKSEKLMLQNVCRELRIAMVHGAISGWYGQVCVILPGDDTLNAIYKDTGETNDLGNPPFTPAVIAGIQTAQALKLLTGNENILRNKVLFTDLLEDTSWVCSIEEEDRYER